MAMSDLDDAVMATKYGSAVEVLDEVLASNPTASLADVRKYASDLMQLAQARLAEVEVQIERGVCRHCGRNITRGNDGEWYHGAIPSWGSRGCRSYSFNRLSGWDETLDRQWKASPS